MQGYSPADKSHLSLILALTREASGVKGQESIYLCNSFCQPAKKKGSRVVFFSFWYWLGTSKAPLSGCQGNAEKKQYCWNEDIELSSVYYILRGGQSFSGMPEASSKGRAHIFSEVLSSDQLWGGENIASIQFMPEISRSKSKDTRDKSLIEAYQNFV